MKKKVKAFKVKAVGRMSGSAVASQRHRWTVLLLVIALAVIVALLINGMPHSGK